MLEIPEENLLEAHWTVHNLSMTAETRGYALQELNSQLKHEMLRSYLHERRSDFTTTFTLSVLVFTPDEFARIVQEQAVELARRMS